MTLAVSSLQSVILTFIPTQSYAYLLVRFVLKPFHINMLAFAEAGLLLLLAYLLVFMFQMLQGPSAAISSYKPGSLGSVSFTLLSRKNMHSVVIKYHTLMLNNGHSFVEAI